MVLLSPCSRRDWGTAPKAMRLLPSPYVQTGTTSLWEQRGTHRSCRAVKVRKEGAEVRGGHERPVVGPEEMGRNTGRLPPQGCSGLGNGKGAAEGLGVSDRRRKGVRRLSRWGTQRSGELGLEIVRTDLCLVSFLLLSLGPGFLQSQQLGGNGEEAATPSPPLATARAQEPGTRYGHDPSGWGMPTEPPLFSPPSHHVISRGQIGCDTASSLERPVRSPSLPKGQVSLVASLKSHREGQPGIGMQTSVEFSLFHSASTPSGFHRAFSHSSLSLPTEQ